MSSNGGQTRNDKAFNLMRKGTMNRKSSFTLVALAALILASTANFAAAQRLKENDRNASPRNRGPLPPIPATTHTFLPSTTATWNSTGNWDTGMIPSGIDEAVVFNTPTAAQVVALDGARMIGSFMLTNNSTFTFNLQNGAGGSLVFDVTSGNASVTVNGTGNVINTISATSTLNDTLLVTVNNTTTTSATGALTMTGGISGAGGFTKDGAGRVSFTTATKTYSGATAIDNGVMRLTNAGRPTGTSGIAVAAGAQLLLDSDANAWGTLGTAGAVLTLNGNGPSSNGALRNDGTGAVSLANNITLASDSTIFQNSTGTFTLSGIVSGSGGLTKAGSATGTLLLNAANIYMGTTTVSAGILQLGNGGTTGSLSTASGIVTNGTFRINRSNAVVQGVDFSGSGISGTGVFSQAGAGSTTLNVANTYAGGTTISAGMLFATADGALGSGNVSLTASGVSLTLQGGVTSQYISNNATLSMVTGSTANLNFIGTNIISGLVLAGAAQSDLGTYGSTASGAMHTFDSFFLGTGTLTLIPEPSTWAMTIMGAGLLLGVQRFRRKKS